MRVTDTSIDDIIKIKVNFGNSNWFVLNIHDKNITFAHVYQSINRIIGNNRELLHLICNGQLITDSLPNTSDYTFKSKISKLDLALQKHQMTLHAIIANKNNTDDTGDIVDQFIIRKYGESRNVTRSSTRIQRNQINNLILQGVANNTLTYDQASMLESVSIALTQEQFNEFTVQIDSTMISPDKLSDTCICGSQLKESPDESDDEDESEYEHEHEHEHEPESSPVGITVLPCGHMFHTECIKRHLTTNSTTCPICSQDVRV